MWKLFSFGKKAVEPVEPKYSPVLPINTDTVGKAILLYTRCCFRDKIATFAFGPAAFYEHPDRGNDYTMPISVFQQAIRGSWGGDVSDAHSTIVVEIFNPGERSTAVLIGGQKVMVSNQDLLNGIRNRETHELLFGDSVEFKGLGDRRYIRDLDSLYYGTWGRWCRYLDEREKARAAAVVDREEEVRRMAAA